MKFLVNEKVKHKLEGNQELEGHRAALDIAIYDSDEYMGEISFSDIII